MTRWEGALCAKVAPEPWYSDEPGDQRYARNVCAVCPLVAECAQYALDRHERYGTWGGVRMYRDPKDNAVARLQLAAVAAGGAVPEGVYAKRAPCTTPIAERRALVRDMYYAGWSVAATAVHLGVSPHAVRHDRELIRRQETAA